MADERRRRLGKRHLAGPLVVLVVVGSIVALMVLGARLTPRLDDWLDGFGAWGPVVYLGICVLAAVLLFPGSVTKLAAGALFGIGEGMVWGFVGAATGSVAAFLVARLGRRTWIEERLRSLPRMTRFDTSVAAHGRRIVFLMRLSPLVPFSIINYALGMSQVRFRDYLVAAPGMIPSVFLYVYSGDVAREVMSAAGGRADKPWWEWVILGVGLVATVLVTQILTRKAREALAHQDPEAEREVEELEDEILDTTI